MVQEKIISKSASTSQDASNDLKQSSTENKPMPQVEWKWLTYLLWFIALFYSILPLINIAKLLSK